MLLSATALAAEGISCGQGLLPKNPLLERLPGSSLPAAQNLCLELSREGFPGECFPGETPPWERIPGNLSLGTDLLGPPVFRD